MWLNAPVIPAVAAPQVLGHGAACKAPLLVGVGSAPRLLHDHGIPAVGVRRVGGAIRLVDAIQHMGLDAILTPHISTQYCHVAVNINNHKTPPCGGAAMWRGASPPCALNAGGPRCCRPPDRVAAQSAGRSAWPRLARQCSPPLPAPLVAAPVSLPGSNHLQAPGSVLGSNCQGPGSCRRTQN